MTDWAALPTLTTPEELAEFGVPAPAARDKVLNALTDAHVEWIAQCRLIFLATSDSDGNCDTSPKGDPQGILHVLDAHTIAIPERPGNKRFDGFHNILRNPHIGILGVIPGRNDTIRINGRAQLVTAAPFFDDMVVRGNRPRLATVVHIDEVFFHCPKAFMRSAAWRPETWDPDAVQSYPQLAKALWRKDATAAEVEAHYAPTRYQKTLYQDD